MAFVFYGAYIDTSLTSVTLCYKFLKKTLPLPINLFLYLVLLTFIATHFFMLSCVINISCRSFCATKRQKTMYELVRVQTLIVQDTAMSCSEILFPSPFTNESSVSIITKINIIKGLLRERFYFLKKALYLCEQICDFWPLPN